MQSKTLMGIYTFSNILNIAFVAKTSARLLAFTHAKTGPPGVMMRRSTAKGDASGMLSMNSLELDSIVLHFGKARIHDANKEEHLLTE